jgi:hypothetical protein
MDAATILFPVEGGQLENLLTKVSLSHVRFEAVAVSSSASSLFVSVEMVCDVSETVCLTQSSEVDVMTDC